MDIPADLVINSEPPFDVDTYVYCSGESRILSVGRTEELENQVSVETFEKVQQEYAFNKTT